MINAIDAWENEGGAIESSHAVADPSAPPATRPGFKTAAKPFTSAGDWTVQAQDSTAHELATSATDKPGARSI